MKHLEDGYKRDDITEDECWIIGDIFLGLLEKYRNDPQIYPHLAYLDGYFMRELNRWREMSDGNISARNEKLN